MISELVTEGVIPLTQENVTAYFRSLGVKEPQSTLQSSLANGKGSQFQSKIEPGTGSSSFIFRSELLTDLTGYINQAEEYIKKLNDENLSIILNKLIELLDEILDKTS